MKGENRDIDLSLSLSLCYFSFPLLADSHWLHVIPYLFLKAFLVGFSSLSVLRFLFGSFFFLSSLTNDRFLDIFGTFRNFRFPQIRVFFYLSLSLPFSS